MGTSGLFLFLIKMQNQKLSEMDAKKLDKEIFEAHLKTFEDVKTEVKNITSDIGSLRGTISTNNELLIRVDERIKRFTKE